MNSVFNMKGTSKVIMGATIVMVVSLAVVLGLVLVLLAELYCSLLLLRRRQLKLASSITATEPTTTNASTANTTNQPDDGPSSNSLTSPLSSFYSHGVLLHAPRSFLFPRVSVVEKEKGIIDGDGFSDQLEIQRGKLHQLLNLQRNSTEISLDHHPLPPTGLDFDLDLKSSPAPPPPPYAHSVVDPVGGRRPLPPQPSSISKSAGGLQGENHVVYISNPIFDNDHAVLELEEGGEEEEECSKVEDEDTPPFETPDTSPARLGKSGDGLEERVTMVKTPPLTPIKQLPPKAVSSLALKFGISGSESNSQNAASYSTSSGSPRTSPSW